MSVAAPFAIPFVLGGALKSNEENRVRNITMKDTQGDVITYPTKIMNIQPTPQDDYRGGGQYSGGNTKSSSGGSKSGGFSSAERGAALHG